MDGAGQEFTQVEAPTWPAVAEGPEAVHRPHVEAQQAFVLCDR